MVGGERRSRPAASLGVVMATAMLASLLGAVAGVGIWETISERSAQQPRLASAQIDAAASGVGSTGTDAKPTARGAVLSASLESGRFELAGVVPSADVADRIREQAATVYGTQMIDRLTIDPSTASAGWLVAAPDVVIALPIISNGSVEIEHTTATIRGSAGSAAKRDLFRSSIAELLGAGMQVVDEVVVDERLPPELVIRKSGAHVIEVTGVVPDEEVRAEIEQTINLTYAGYAVQADLTVDDSVEDTFALHDLPGFAELFFGFPAWELSYVDDTLRSSSSGSAVFEAGSASVPPLGTLILDNMAARLAGTPGLVLTVAGHTDSTGGADHNLLLSEQRALAVVGYLVTTHDIAPARLTAVGYGEEQPIDGNDTDEGRERNRRVDFHFSLTETAQP